MGSSSYGQAIGGLGQMITGIWGNNAAGQALSSGLGKASDTLNQYYGNAAAQQQPYADVGAVGLAGQQNIANQAPPTSNFQYDYRQDPAYQNQLTAGNQNIKSNAASLGSLFSGSTLKGLQAYGSNLANQSYNQNYNRAFNTYTNQRDFNTQQLLNKYSQYMGLTGIGQAAANNLTGMQTQLGQSQAGINVAQGQANAGAVMGEANAIGNGIGSMFGSSSGGGGGGGGGGGSSGFSLGSLFGSGSSGDSSMSSEPDTGGSTSSDMGASS